MKSLKEEVELKIKECKDDISEYTDDELFDLANMIADELDLFERILVNLKSNE